MMKVTFRVADVGGRKVVLPLAEFAGGKEEQEVVGDKLHVSLSRRGGSCIYALSKMDAHAGHAPAWRPDGGAPSGSSASDMTIDSYIARITSEIKEKAEKFYGASEVPTSVTFETKEITAKEAYAVLTVAGGEDEDEGDGDQDPGQGKVDWGKYGVN